MASLVQHVRQKLCMFVRAVLAETVLLATRPPLKQKSRMLYI